MAMTEIDKMLVREARERDIAKDQWQIDAQREAERQRTRYLRKPVVG